MKPFLLLLLASGPLWGQSDADRKPDRVITINAERFAFSPSKVTVKRGDLVEFVLTSDDTDHGFRIPEAGIEVAIPPQRRGEARVRFIARQKGKFTFECSRPCGAGHNLMRGTLEVK
ncbi:MAG: cupredoxin domain-containing protein [Bryobacteraceae bacterium]